MGWLDAVRDANGAVTRSTHDALGRLLETITNERVGLPSTAATNVRTQYAYDPVGNLLRLTDPRQHVTAFSYTALG